MTTEFEIKIGRPENRARYEECVSKIKKAFADYRTFSAVDTEKRLKWTGDEYVLREDGSFTRIGDKKDNINSLEADISTFINYVNGPVKNAGSKACPKGNLGKSVTRLSDLIDKELPAMSCAVTRPVKGSLYWVTKEEYNEHNLVAFRQILEDRTTFDMVYVIPLKYSSLNFEKDKLSGYMDSCEVADCNKPKRDLNLENLFTRALSGVDYIGITEGSLDIEGTSVNISRKKNLIVKIVSGGAVVVLGANPEKSKVIYSCYYPSTENIAASLEGIMKALERLCELPYEDDAYMNCKVEEIDSTIALTYLLANTLR